MESMREVYSNIGRYFERVIKKDCIHYIFFRPKAMMYNSRMSDFGYEYCNDIAVVSLDEMELIKVINNPNAGKFISDHKMFCKLWNISNVDDFVGLSGEAYSKSFFNRLQEEGSSGYRTPRVALKK